MKKILSFILISGVFILVGYAQNCSIIYVSLNGTAKNSGSKIELKDLLTAFESVTENDVIRIAAGVYNLDTPLEIASNNIRVEGFFLADEDWTKISLAGATTLHRTSGNPKGPSFLQRLVALITSGRTGFSFHDITISTADGNALGMSTYGVYLSGCSNYKFVRCQILPGNASAGQNGVAGTACVNGGNGIAGSLGSCDGGTFTFSSGSAGGAGGNGGNGGVEASAGYQGNPGAPGSAGSFGLPGLAGVHRTPGTDGFELTGFCNAGDAGIGGQGGQGGQNCYCNQREARS